MQKVLVSENITSDCFTSFHNFLNAKSSLQLDRLNLSEIDDLEDYIYNVCKHLFKSSAVYYISVYELKKQTGIDMKDVYSVGHGSVLLQ